MPLELELQLELRVLGTEHGPSAETVQAFNGAEASLWPSLPFVLTFFFSVRVAEPYH